MNVKDIDFSSEIWFSTSRSSGKGGQHVNKTESRVSLYFSVSDSSLLSENQKSLIIKNLEGKLSQDFQLQIDVEESRSQLKNKKVAIERFYNLLEKALFVPKKRKETKPSKAAIKRRLNAKKKRGDLKQNRRKDNLL
tara:strand:+ start:54 stop:464 length:411 start_codon:yes stop_codon:yes gene_type:complete